MTEERELQRRSQHARLFQLDALRGIAAVTVVLHHFRFAFVTSDPVWYLKPFFAGTQSVILFFVLSGYVLSIPYWNRKQTPYIPYVIRRFCRIYLPYAAAAVIAILFAMHFEGRRLPLTWWFYGTWQTPVTSALVVDQFLMSTMANFNTAFWSLRFEMQMSIVLPLFLWLMRRLNPFAVTAGFCVLIYARPNHLSQQFNWHHLNMSLEICFLFLLGACLAAYKQPLESVWRRMGKLWQWTILACSCLLFWQIVPVTNVSILLRWNIFAGIGAAGIILSALYIESFAQKLESRLLEYLGRISYSLYLMHGTVLFAMLDIFYWKLPRAVLAIIFILVSVAVAHVFCRLVEEPSIRLGKRADSLLRRSWPQGSETR